MRRRSVGDRAPAAADTSAWPPIEYRRPVTVAAPSLPGGTPLTVPRAKIAALSSRTWVADAVRVHVLKENEAAQAPQGERSRHLEEHRIDPDRLALHRETEACEGYESAAQHLDRVRGRAAQRQRSRDQSHAGVGERRAGGRDGAGGDQAGAAEVR